MVAILYPGGPAAKETPELLGCMENALGLRPFFEKRGIQFLASSDKEAGLDRELPDTDILITTPFWPAYVTRERISKAPKLRLVLTAGVGSDHIDLAAAAEHNVTVAEITGSNVVSVAEHAVMQILVLVRNFIPDTSRSWKVDGTLERLPRNRTTLKGKRWGSWVPGASARDWRFDLGRLAFPCSTTTLDGSARWKRKYWE